MRRVLGRCLRRRRLHRRLLRRRRRHRFHHRLCLRRRRRHHVQRVIASLRPRLRLSSVCRCRRRRLRRRCHRRRRAFRIGTRSDGVVPGVLRGQWDVGDVRQSVLRGSRVLPEDLELYGVRRDAVSVAAASVAVARAVPPSVDSLATVAATVADAAETFRLRTSSDLASEPAVAAACAAVAAGCCRGCCEAPKLASERLGCGAVSAVGAVWL